MDRSDFTLGENIITNIYNYDDQGNEYIKEISGKVIQITNDFVVTDNGFYKETFKYSQFSPNIVFDKNDVSHDVSIESYFDDIVNTCIKSLEINKKGYVFNEEQLDTVLKRVSIKNIKVNRKDNIIYLTVKNF